MGMKYVCSGGGMYVKGSVARWVGKRFTSIDYLDVEDFVNDKY